MDEHDEALSVRAQARLGSTLRGKYRLDRVLGIGGMATVFAATHRNQAELAVKLLHPELSLREDLRKRFLREGYVGNSVKHPGAVLVVDDDIAEDGSAFLVMELLRGRSLEELWERAGRALPTRVVTSLVLQLLEVLAAAHEKAIVHRDLKPANIFLTIDGSLKVLDFGIARLRDAVGGSEHATRTGTLMGTPSFMAPEQAQAVAAEIDGQTDLWAVGATMYTLLSGQLVHDGDNSSQLLIRAGTSRARALLSVAPHVEAPIAEVVDCALTFEKPGRWPNAMAMHAALLTASEKAFGRAPGREVLTSLIESAAVTRRMDSAAPTLGASMAVMSPRMVVSGEDDVRVNAPTFATPGTQSSAGLARSVRPQGGMIAAGLTPPPALPGLSTGNPVSAEAATLANPRRSVPLSTVVIGMVVLVAAMAAGLFLLRPRPAVLPTTTASTSVTPPAETTSPPASAAPPPSAAPAPSTAASAVAVAPPVVAPVPTVAPPTPPTPAPTKQIKPAAVVVAPKPAEPAPPDCTTPYTLDADGNKKWRKECVQ